MAVLCGWTTNIKHEIPLKSGVGLRLYTVPKLGTGSNNKVQTKKKVDLFRDRLFFINQVIRLLDLRVVF